MFTRIARRYDLMNSLMTGGRHHAWRRKVADHAAGAPGGPVLDLATGTADLAIAVRRRTPGRFVAGADFSEGMLQIGQAKLRQAAWRASSSSPPTRSRCRFGTAPSPA